MKAKEFIPQSKPRNFVAKNQKTAGAGAHKDKKRAEKQGDVKHKNKFNYKQDDWSGNFERRMKEGVAEGAPIVVMPRADRPGGPLGKKPEQPKQRYMGDIPDTSPPPSTEKRGVKGRPGQRPMPEQGVAEGNDDDVWGPQGRFAGDKHVNVGSVSVKPISVGDLVKYFGEPAHVVALSKDKKVARITSKSGDKTLNVKTSDLKQLGQDVAERVRDPEDWDEGNTEPPNNFAVYINGKKWKVFQGRGMYANDFKEKQHYQQLKAWADKKSAATGKKWTVHITGEAPTVSEARQSAAVKLSRAWDREQAKSAASRERAKELLNPSKKDDKKEQGK